MLIFFIATFLILISDFKKKQENDEIQSEKYINNIYMSNFFTNSKIDDTINEFIELIIKDEDSAINYLDNVDKDLLEPLLTRKIDSRYCNNIIPCDNMLLYAIKQGKEKLVSKILDTNVIRPQHLNEKKQNALFFAIYNNQYKIAVNLINTGLYNPEEIDYNEQIIFEYIEHHYRLFKNNNDDGKNDNIIDLLLDFFIKLLDYYIKTDITIKSNTNFQDMIDFICSDEYLKTRIKQKLLKIKKMKNNNPMKINVDKFEEIISLDNEDFCNDPIKAETLNPDNDLEIAVEPDLEINSKKKKKKSKNTTFATLINTEVPSMAIPYNDENFDLDYNPERDDTIHLLRKRYPGGKNKSKKIKRKNKTKKNKTRNLR